jgi:hypothetical protein
MNLIHMGTPAVKTRATPETGMRGELKASVHLKPAAKVCDVNNDRIYFHDSTALCQPTNASLK